MNKKRRKISYESTIILDRQYEILAFGYECKIFNDPTTANKINQESHLQAWKTTEKRAIADLIWMDRFDVRHYLDVDEFLLDLKSNMGEKAIIDKTFDRERYFDLTCDDEEESNTTATSRNNARISYSYNDDNSECRTSIEKKELNPVQKEIIRKYKTPSNMDIPSTQQQLVIIEDIANQINTAASKDANLLEIKLQVRNSRNPLYSFLNKQDPLYGFYKHISWISKSGLGNYDSSSSSSDEDEDLKIPPDIRQIIQKTAQFITKSNQGSQLEQHIRTKNGHDPKFAFLDTHHPYHGYFRSLVTKGIV